MLFPGLGIQAASIQGAAESEIGFEHRGRIRHDARHVGNQAKLLLYRGEQLVRFAGGLFWVNDRKTSHFDSPLHLISVTSNTAILEVTNLDVEVRRKFQ
jgi:hypothetical protein